MNDAASVLIIVLAVVLVIFLVISIVLAVYLIRIAKQVKEASENVNRISQTTKNIVSGLVSFTSPAFLKALSAGISEKVKNHFSKTEEKKNKKGNKEDVREKK